jgi:replicative DNA helicase
MANSPAAVERILPVNLSAERSVLGAIIEDDSMLPEVTATGLRVADFALSDHQRIFAAMLELWQQKKPVDMILLTERLGNRVEDAVVVASLIEGVIVHPDHVLHHVEIIRSKAQLRNLLRIAEWITHVVDENADPDALIEQAIGKLEAIAAQEVKA